MAQIFLRDFVELDGTKCVYLTDDNDGASLKNDQSRRLVPLHPDLLALGLWDRVERLRAQSAERLFPDMKIDGKSGAGYAICKGFSYLLGRSEIKPRRANGTLGFHSLRKNVIQQLQAPHCLPNVAARWSGTRRERTFTQRITCVPGRRRSWLRFSRVALG